MFTVTEEYTYIGENSYLYWKLSSRIYSFPVMNFNSPDSHTGAYTTLNAAFPPETLSTMSPEPE